MYEAFITTGKKDKYKTRSHSGRIHKAFVHGLNPHNHDFVCSCCRLPVSANPQVAAVNNRNHCPYCLASRHMDWREPGDRLSACKAPMHPVALAFKRTQKKYGAGAGELMLVHHCSDCGKVSINRLAADDDPGQIWMIFEKSVKIDSNIRRKIESTGISLLVERDRHALCRQLFGRDCLSESTLVEWKGLLPSFDRMK